MLKLNNLEVHKIMFGGKEIYKSMAEGKIVYGYNETTPPTPIEWIEHFDYNGLDEIQNWPGIGSVMDINTGDSNWYLATRNDENPYTQNYCYEYIKLGIVQNYLGKTYNNISMPTVGPDGGTDGKALLMYNAWRTRGMAAYKLPDNFINYGSLTIEFDAFVCEGASDNTATFFDIVNDLNHWGIDYGGLPLNRDLAKGHWYHFEAEDFNVPKSSNDLYLIFYNVAGNTGSTSNMPIIIDNIKIYPNM